MFKCAGEGGRISLGIEGELEVAEVEGIAELEGTPKEPESPPRIPTRRKLKIQVQHLPDIQHVDYSCKEQIEQCVRRSRCIDKAELVVFGRRLREVWMEGFVRDGGRWV